MRALRVLVRALLGLAALAPWVWLALFTAMALAATYHLGRLPRYNDPDPKHIAHLAPLYGLASALLMPLALSPLAVGACLAIRSFVSPDIRDERWRLLAYGVGYALVAVVMLGDVLGLGDWFLD